MMEEIEEMMSLLEIHELSSEEITVIEEEEGYGTSRTEGKNGSISSCACFSSSLLFNRSSLWKDTVDIRSRNTVDWKELITHFTRFDPLSVTIRECHTSHDHFHH